MIQYRRFIQRDISGLLLREQPLTKERNERLVGGRWFLCPLYRKLPQALHSLRDLAVISWRRRTGNKFAILKFNDVSLIDSRVFGRTKTRAAQGNCATWLHGRKRRHLIRVDFAQDVRVARIENRNTNNEPIPPGNHVPDNAVNLERLVTITLRSTGRIIAEFAPQRGRCRFLDRRSWLCRRGGSLRLLVATSGKHHHDNCSKKRFTRAGQQSHAAKISATRGVCKGKSGLSFAGCHEPEGRRAQGIVPERTQPLASDVEDPQASAVGRA